MAFIELIDRNLEAKGLDSGPVEPKKEDSEIKENA